MLIVAQSVACPMRAHSCTYQGSCVSFHRALIRTMSTGATDGLRLRNAGIPTYGVSGLFYSETFSHGMNERIPVRAFYQGLEFMYRLVKGVTGAPRPIS